nr:putative transposase (putative), gypsy type [Tanacetum cinerariifolium]
MSSIYDVTSTLTQTALDAFCQKYHIPGSVHLELPGPNHNIRNSPAGKIGVYTKFFDFANFRIPLFRFLVDVLEYFSINLSQLSVIAAAKISHFEILCHVHGYVPTVGLFRRFYVKSKNKEMDLFAFIRHVDPTKVRIGERKIEEGQVMLLDSTDGRVIPLAGEDSQAQLVVRVDLGGQNDNIKNLNEGSGDADQENHFEDSDRASQDEAVTIVVDEEFWAATADKPNSKKKKRRGVGASGSDHPPNKLREDHSTSGDADASTGGKSLVAIQGLLKCSTLAMKVGITAAATAPFVTSSVTPTSEREGDGNTDSISGTNLRTRRPYERFVIFLDSSHHSSTNVADAEVASLVRGRASFSSSSKYFADSASIGATGPDVAGPSNTVGTELSVDTFYVSQEIDSETLRQIYLAPPGLFSQLRSMDYDQLFAKFNVGAARQTCLSAEEKDIEIENLKAQLSLKEVEAAEAIHLRNQNSALEEEKNALEGKVTTLESAAAAKETELADVFADKVSLLETTCSGLHDQVSCYELFKEQCEAIQDEHAKALSDRVAGLDSKLMALAHHLDEELYPRFLTTISARCVSAVLAFRDLDFKLISRLESQKDASIADIMSLLRLERPSVETLEVIRCFVSPFFISDAMGVMADPLSSENLIGKASTSGVPVTATATTALAISVTAANISSISPISVAGYDMVDVGVQDTAPHSQRLCLKRKIWRLHRSILRPVDPVLVTVLPEMSP